MKRIWPETVHYFYDKIQKISRLKPSNRHPLNHGFPEADPFFIIGSGRSGNTLLRRIITQAPGIHIPPETYVLSSLIKLYRQNDYLRWEQLVNLMLANIEYSPEFDTFQLENLRELAAQLYDVPESQRSLALIIDRFYRFHADKKQVPCVRWGDKTPLNTLYLERIHQVFPTAQYVNIVRDGYDVAYSYVNAGLYSDLEEAARRWKESIRRADQFIRKNPEAVKTILYEELVSNPAKVVREVCDFLQLEYSDSLLGEEHSIQMGDVEMKDHHSNVKKPITTKSIGKGRRNLSTEQKKILDSLIGKELVEKGYEKSE